jgi:hypothetical protein
LHLIGHGCRLSETFVKISSTLTLLFSVTVPVWPQQPLQIHLTNVGQVDGSILISPGGAVVDFDIGEELVHKNCSMPLAYLVQFAIDHIEYLIPSTYHRVSPCSLGVRTIL